MVPATGQAGTQHSLLHRSFQARLTISRTARNGEALPALEGFHMLLVDGQIWKPEQAEILSARDGASQIKSEDVVD